MGEDQRRAIEARQLTGQEKARRADVVVENDGDQDRLREKAKALVEQVLGEKGFDSEEGARE
jgi:Dephospho-CoA kinase